MNTMTYNGYQAAVEFDDAAELFHGEVTGLRDVITFQGKSVAELKRAFKDSVEDYLAYCKERGEAPEKPFSGQFIVRTDPQAHRMAVLAAKSKGMSLNTWVTKAIETASGAMKITREPHSGRFGTKKITKKASGPSSRATKRA